MVRFAGALLFALAATACGGSAHPSPPAAELGRPFDLAPGATATLAQADLRVTLERVADDSRCPVDVTCAWAGDAVAHVRLETGAGTEVHGLHLNRGEGRPGLAEQGAFVVGLVELAPEPRAGQPIAPGDYRATFVVTQK
jgi:hypothetical protein